MNPSIPPPSSPPIDWNLTNTELARITGTSPQDIAAARRVLGIEKTSKFYPRCLAWDWAKSDTEISRAERVPVSNVTKWRWRLKKPTVEGGRTKVDRHYINIKSRYDFSKIDWVNTCDRAIAIELGATREYVRQMRAQLGHPKCYHNDLKYREFVKIFEPFRKTGVSYEEAKKKFSIKQYDVCHLLHPQWNKT